MKSPSELHHGHELFELWHQGGSRLVAFLRNHPSMIEAMVRVVKAVDTVVFSAEPTPEQWDALRLARQNMGLIFWDVAEDLS